MRRFPLLMAAAAMTASAAAHAADKISFQLSWRPQAEHGCFYQAAAAGIYARHGLDVTIVPGGP
jgi:NitT/TauT family transport system substrate-binding protein